VLGKILGQVIRESDGQGLLDDVEDLRHRAIAARQHDPGGACPVDAGARADDDIAVLVASWPLERAAATEPVRESLAAATAALAATLGSAQRAALLDRLKVHPVLTAHPTEARRRAVTEALRRISVQLDNLHSPQLGASAGTPWRSW